MRLNIPVTYGQYPLEFSSIFSAANFLAVLHFFSSSFLAFFHADSFAFSVSRSLTFNQCNRHDMVTSMVRIFRSIWIRCFLDRYSTYRKWYGGIWECHYLEDCHSFIWFPVTQAKCWPQYRPMASKGTPVVEVWPITYQV